VMWVGGLGGLVCLGGWCGGGSGGEIHQGGGRGWFGE